MTLFCIPLPTVLGALPKWSQGSLKEFGKGPCLAQLQPTLAFIQSCFSWPLNFKKCLSHVRLHFFLKCLSHGNYTIELISYMIKMNKLWFATKNHMNKNIIFNKRPPWQKASKAKSYPPTNKFRSIIIAFIEC
jgi:hypothetical protein